MSTVLSAVVIGHKDDASEAYESLKSHHPDWADHKTGYEVKFIKGKRVGVDEETRIAEMVKQFGESRGAVDAPATAISLHVGDEPSGPPLEEERVLLDLRQGDWFIGGGGSISLTTSGREAFIAASNGLTIEEIDLRSVRITPIGDARIDTKMEVGPPSSERESETRFFLVNVADARMPRWETGKETFEEALGRVHDIRPPLAPTNGYEVIQMTRFKEVEAVQITVSLPVKVSFYKRKDVERRARRLAHEKHEGAWLFVSALAD